MYTQCSIVPKSGRSLRKLIFNGCLIVQRVKNEKNVVNIVFKIFVNLAWSICKYLWNSSQMFSFVQFYTIMMIPLHIGICRTDTWETKCRCTGTRLILLRDIQFTHVQCSEVQLWKRCFLKFFFTLNEANTCVALPNAWRRSMRALS
jgi:hypothetical protein